MGAKTSIQRARAAMLKIRALFPSCPEGQLQAAIVERSVMDIATYKDQARTHDEALVRLKMRRVITQRGTRAWVQVINNISHAERSKQAADEHRMAALRHLSRNIYSAELCGVDSDAIRRILAMADIAFQATEQKIKKRRLLDVNRYCGAQARRRQACV